MTPESEKRVREIEEFYAGFKGSGGDAAYIEEEEALANASAIREMIDALAFSNRQREELTRNVDALMKQLSEAQARTREVK